MEYKNPDVPQIVLLCAMLMVHTDAERINKIRSLVGGWNDLNQQIFLFKQSEERLLSKASKEGLSCEEIETLSKVSIGLKERVHKLQAFLRGCRKTVQKNWKGKFE